MKRILYNLTALFLASVCLVSCSDDEVEGAQSLSVASFYPTIVMEGVEVTVTGTGFEAVKEVLFPGGVAAAGITKVDERTLKVITPAGVSEAEAALVLKSEHAEVASRQTIREAKPTFLSYQFTEKEGAMTGTGMTINGRDLLLVEDLVFTLDDNSLLINALDMTRKSNTAIKLTLPQDAPVGEGVQVTLNFKNGTEMSLPQIDILQGSGGGSWVQQEVAVYSGDPVDVGAWANSVQIPATAFADAKVDDLIRVYISDCGDNAQGSLKNGSTWAGLTSELEYFDITASAANGYYEQAVTDEILTQLQASGLIVSGQNYVVQKVSLFTSVWVEGGDEELTDPITPQTIMLNDFEEHDGHNSSWDGSWSDAEATEFPVDDKGNVYLHLVKPLEGWLVNCNHQNIGTVSGIENYVIKFDIKIEAGVVGASEAEMQIVLADKWLWVGAGLFPETTNEKWVTVSRNISDLSGDLTGDLEIGTLNNGLYGAKIPQGICIDNLRLDPKK